MLDVDQGLPFMVCVSSRILRCHSFHLGNLLSNLEWWNMSRSALIKPASHEMVRFDFIQVRLDFGTDSQAIFKTRLTAWRKAASNRQINQVWHRAGDHVQSFFDLS